MPPTVFPTGAVANMQYPLLLHTLKMMLYSGGWMSRVADNVLHAVKQPPKDTEGGDKTPMRPLSLPDEPVEGTG